MSRKKVEIVDTLKVRNANAEIFEVTVFQEFIYSPTMGKPNHWIPGMKELRLSDGRPLNRIDDDTFEIFDSKERLSRV